MRANSSGAFRTTISLICEVYGPGVSRAGAAAALQPRWQASTQVLFIRWTGQPNLYRYLEIFCNFLQRFIQCPKFTSGHQCGR